MNIGIIGCGVVAIGSHVPAYRQLGHDVIALCDTAEGRAERFASELGIKHYYTDYRELLARDDIDAVSVCVPTFLHEEVAIAALEAGKHLYLEKPPAYDAKGIINIVNAKNKAKKILLVGSNSIYQPQYKIAKSIVDSGRLGNVYVAKVNRVHRRDIPNGWMTKKNLSRGFAIMEGLVHNLDQILFLLDEPEPYCLSCVTYNMFSNYPPLNYNYPMDAVEQKSWQGPKETEDAVLGMINFKNGLTLQIECFRAANAKESYNLMLYGDKAGLCVDHKKISSGSPGGLVLYEEVQRGVFTESDLEFNKVKLSHLEAVRHFTECIAENKETMSNGERAILLMKIIDAVFSSAEQNGRQVNIL